MKLNVTQPVPPEQEIAVEVIASSIVAISDAMKAINRTRLTRKAIVALIHERSKIGRGDIEIVLNNMDQLEATWLKPKPSVK